jgi:glycosyltransferase involved in cell wall biosynthesis
MIEAIEQLAGKNISFHFFGDIDSAYDEKLDPSKNSQIFRYGKYPPGKLPEELFSCDISLHASLCPETYALSLSEAWASGLIPIVSNIGALGERVTEGINGLKVTVGSSDALADAILKINNDPTFRQSLLIQASSMPISWIGQHAKQLVAYYQKLIFVMPTIKAVPKVIEVNNRFPLLVWAFFSLPPKRGNSSLGHYLNKIKIFLTGNIS